MELITNWLKGTKNYHVGKAIYATLGHDKHVHALLDGPKTPMAEKALHEGLQKLLSKPNPIVKSTTEEAGVMPTNTNDAVLNALAEEWKKPYGQMKFLQAQLHQHGNKNTAEAIEFRKTKALQILQLEQSCMAVWAKRDYYIKNGLLPDATVPTVAIPTSPIELAKKITSCQREIRLYRGKLAKDPSQAKYVLKVDGLLKLHLTLTGKKYDFKEAKHG